jgi:hypothetical protein
VAVDGFGGDLNGFALVRKGSLKNDVTILEVGKFGSRIAGKQDGEKDDGN